MSITEIYRQTIKPLPAADRFRLATLILNDIPPQDVVDQNDQWTDTDMKDFTTASWRHMQAADEELQHA